MTETADGRGGGPRVLAAGSGCPDCSTRTPTSCRPHPAAVWAEFDSAGPKIGREWPIRYRAVARGAGRASCGRSASAASRRCPTPTSPASRRTSTTGRATSRPTCPRSVWSATFFPEPEAAAYVEELVDDGRRGVQGARAGGGVRPRRPAARPGLGRARRRRHAGRHPRRLGTGRQRLHRTGAAAPGAGPASAADGDRRPPGRAGVRGVPGDRRDPRAGPPRHHDGVHRLLHPVPGRARAAARSTCRSGCCSARDFPTSRTPTPTSSRASPGLDLGDDWLRAVCWDNGVRLFGDPSGEPPH